MRSGGKLPGYAPGLWKAIALLGNRSLVAADATAQAVAQRAALALITGMDNTTEDGI